MWNLFKPKFLVSIHDCSDVVIHSALRDQGFVGDLFKWVEEKHGVKRKWKNSTMSNYLVFDSEHDYTMFLMKL
jgi:hypothetical protein